MQNKQRQERLKRESTGNLAQNKQRQEPSLNEKALETWLIKALETWLISGVKFINITSSQPLSTQSHQKSRTSLGQVRKGTFNERVSSYKLIKKWKRLLQTDQETKSLFHRSSSPFILWSFVFQNHVVFWSQTNASPQYVLQHCSLFRKGVHHWCARWNLCVQKCK